MKKITLALICVLSSANLFSQVTAYTDVTEFENAFSGTLILEDFAGGPQDPSICGFSVTDGGDDCFASGEVVSGFELSATHESPIVYLPAGFLPSDNSTARLGANSGLEITVITFTSNNVFAVGHSLHVDNNGDFNYKIYNRDNVLIYDQTVSFSPFYGAITNEPIGHVEIRNIADAGELIGDLQFGTQALAVVKNAKNTFVAFPNPVNDILNITSEKQIVAITVVNMLGQTVMQKQVNDNLISLDLSNVQAGNYFVRADFEDETAAPFRITKN